MTTTIVTIMSTILLLADSELVMMMTMVISTTTIMMMHDDDYDIITIAMVMTTMTMMMTCLLYSSVEGDERAHNEPWDGPHQPRMGRATGSGRGHWGVRGPELDNDGLWQRRETTRQCNIHHRQLTKHHVPFSASAVQILLRGNRSPFPLLTMDVFRGVSGFKPQIRSC